MERAELARLLGMPRGCGPGSGEPVFIAERDHARFMAKFSSAVAGDAPIFLGDPVWGNAQRVRWEPLVARAAAMQAPEDRGWLLIPTGGTSGGLRFAAHDQNTLHAAITGFCGHFRLKQVNAVGVLPLYHVGGLLSWLRCAVTGGVFTPWDWKALEAGRRPSLPSGEWNISLVPTQLQRLLGAKEAVDWLKGFQNIFLGGGPIWPDLAEAAAAAQLRISLSYGLTETAAMVTALQPEEFLAGARSCGSPLPHAKLALAEDGTVHVAGESVFRGYYPDRIQTCELETGDLGRIDERGHLHILGRRDAVIITGGKKVQPAEVEAALRASGEFSDVAVLGLPDPEWGETVVACYEAGGATPDVAKASASLAPYQRPKRFVAVAPWPRPAQGKIDRTILRAAVTDRLSSNR